MNEDILWGEPDRGPRHLPETLWEEIDRPGCYLLLGTGLIARLPRSALGPGGLPLVALVSNGELQVVRISDNPAERIEVLRSIVLRHGYPLHL
jgi:hypothetical protein